MTAPTMAEKLSDVCDDTRVEAFVVDMNDTSAELIDHMLKLERKGAAKAAKGSEAL